MLVGTHVIVKYERACQRPVRAPEVDAIAVRGILALGVRLQVARYNS